MSTAKGSRPPWTRQAPNARDRRKRFAPAARASAEAAGGGVALDRDIEVGERPAQQRVADPSPDGPRPRVQLDERRQRRDERGQRLLGAAAASAHPT